MDSGKLPNYRSSYLLRFHPYPRVKPSARERAIAALEVTDNDTVSSHALISAPFLQPANSDSELANGKQNLDNAIYATQSFDTSRRRLSLSSLVVDLALRPARKPSSRT